MVPDDHSALSRLLMRGPPDEPIRMRLVVEARGIEWWAVLEVGGVKVLERGPFDRLHEAEQACERLERDLDVEGWR